MTPEDRGERGAALSVGQKKHHAEISREDRAAKCRSGLVVPEKAVCPCGALLVGSIILPGKTSEVVRTLCGGCGKLLVLTNITDRKAMCVNMSSAEIGKFEEELKAAMNRKSTVVRKTNMSYTPNDKVLLRLGYSLHGRSWSNVAKYVFHEDFLEDKDAKKRFMAFGSAEMKRVSEDARKVIETIDMENMSPGVLIFSDDGTIGVNEKVLKRHTTAKQRKALYDGM